MKHKNFIAILISLFFLILHHASTKPPVNYNDSDAFTWWYLLIFIGVPLIFFLYFALLFAESDREEKPRFVLSAIMVALGIILLFVLHKIKTRTTEQEYMALFGYAVAVIYISIGLWFLYFKKRYSSEAKSLKELPLIAQKLGLEYIESSYYDRAGDMKGVYNGYRVEILPYGESGDGRFVVYLNKNLGNCEISFDRRMYKPPEGMVAFDSENALFDSRFKTRYATRELAEKIRNAGERLDPVINFIRRWRITHRWAFGILARSWLEISDDAIRYSDVPLKGGSYGLPASRVERILPDLIAMVQAFEAIASIKDR